MRKKSNTRQNNDIFVVESVSLLMIRHPLKRQNDRCTPSQMIMNEIY